jgi:hypothetical protein
MKVEKARNIVILLTAAGLAAVVGMIVFFMLPTFREVRELSGKIIGAETEIQAQYNSRKNLLSTIGLIKSAQGLIGELSTQFTPVGDELTFIEAMEAVAESNGVTQRLQLSGAERPDIPELSKAFDLQLAGPMLQVFKTLVDVERLPAIVVIESVDLRSSGDGGITVTLRGAGATPPAGL